MDQTIKISHSVIKRLTSVKEQCSGIIYGIINKHTVTIVTFDLNTDATETLHYSFPVQIVPCGVFQISNINKNNDLLERISDDLIKKNPVFIYKQIRSNEVIASVSIDGIIKNVSYEVVSDLYSQFLYLMITGDFTIRCEASTKAIQDTFHNLKRTVSSGALAFNFLKTNIFLMNENKLSPNLNGETSLSGFYNEINEYEVNKKNKQFNSPKGLDIILLKQVTKNLNNTVKGHAPLCILDKSPQKIISSLVQIKCLAMVHVDTKLKDLYDILIESLIRYLNLYQHSFLEQYNNDKELELEAFHFNPAQCGHFLTVLYPSRENEKLLKFKRQLLHKQLMLEEMLPIFRRANRYVFENEEKRNAPLINPHIGLKSTDNGGQIALVRGNYSYYHYLQDKMEDSGWGCAYRSLQTLASWFILQGYVDKKVPTFTDIQKCLVDIKDKPVTFVGSRQWIGSTEVSFVLDSLLGVCSKILYVSSGEDMGSKGPELVEHFERYGSPIMIGGGVLAHTILGVDYNRLTGSVRFLILDPHYTGSEDLHTIQSKGWCGWKTVDFWDKASYYNMCLPIVPREV